MTSKGFLENVFLIEENGKVVEILAKGDVLPKYDLFFDLDGVVLPSFVNAHTHLELSGIENRSHYDSHPVLWDWIIETIKYKRALLPEHFVKNIEKGEEILYANGTSIVGDVRSVMPEGPFFTKLEGYIFFEVLGYDEKLLDEKLNFLKKFLDATIDYKHINAGISIHTLYTTSFSAAKKLISFARKRRLPIMIHLAETIYEDALFFKGEEEGFKKIFPDVTFERLGFLSYGDIIDYLDLGKDSFLVHCVTLNKKDWAKIKERNINVVLCPRSNHFWGERLPDFDEVINQKINFLIGTDSLRTNNELNILKEARFLYGISKAKGRAEMILEGLTYRGRLLLPTFGVGVEKGDLCSFVFFPSMQGRAEDIPHLLLSSDINPLSYQKEFCDEAFNFFKK